MNPFDLPPSADAAPGQVLNLSRRGFMGMAAGALALGVAVPPGVTHAQAAAGAVKPGTRVPAFLTIQPDGRVHLRSPFIEGGQGVDTAMAQMVGEELGVAPARFVVECAPPGPDYAIVSGMGRVTGGSNSVRSSYDTMRRLGASARLMLMQAAAARWSVPVSSLSTADGQVRHTASGRSIGYGELAEAAARLPVPAEAPLRDARQFRYIGKPVPRLDAHDKSTGQLKYTIDLSVPGMLLAAVQHAPRQGGEPGEMANEAEVKAMPGVHSIHRLPGAVAVVADRWWRARRAVEALRVTWREPAAGTPYAMPADFSSARLRQQLIAAPGPGAVAETHGDVAGALKSAARTIEATYDAPFLAHAQMEPPATLARFNADGSLELWMPNQAQDMFHADIAKLTGLPLDKITLHSPPLGGFFGRHFLYDTGNPYPQAIALAKAVGKPVKVIWSREEEFLRDFLRPLGVARFKAGLDAQGLPVALQAEAVGAGTTGRLYGAKPGADASAVEGITGKRYAIANRRVAEVRVPHPVRLGYWRSVGHSLNDFFYECFFDEMAAAGQHDPYELRLRLLKDEPRLHTLLTAVGELSGGWKRGPFSAPDGSRRARGVAMASPFGSEVATIAEVSLQGEQVRVHDVWVAIDPGRIVNPAIIEAQVQGAVALGLSETLVEAYEYEAGVPTARNFGAYPVLTRALMPRVHVRIVESGAPMGGVGEPGLPGVPPAVVNALAALTGQRVRALPLSRSFTPARNA
ncbi:MAG: xanthine dehydrogenase family protein molybdopterin-binding subunit [Pseudomonadota bacterium]|nr:xanthine dehydrogenase family protein molybdopterin-binding subunit [Pseudomonadota bacterium]